CGQMGTGASKLPTRTSSDVKDVASETGCEILACKNHHQRYREWTPRRSRLAVASANCDSRRPARRDRFMELRRSGTCGGSDRNRSCGGSPPISDVGISP